MTNENILEVDGIRQEFGGLVALDNVSFNVRKGEIHGLIGPNGAGKSTLINVITGIYKPRQGKVSVSGTTLTGMRPDQVYAAGIARTFQNIRVWPELSLFDNVMIGAYRSSEIQPWNALLRKKKLRQRVTGMEKATLEALATFDLDKIADRPAGSLSYGQKKLLELARAVVASPTLLLLDEPAAGLNPVEVGNLQERIKSLVSGGTSVLVIEHNMKFVMGLCENVSVLNFGRKIMTGTPSEVQNSPDVIEAYLGSTSFQNSKKS
jgi:branched-chain amino acid transport system ATP-binding protein